MQTQVRLLRILESGEFINRVFKVQVDVRIVAATNVNISEAISKEKFREDLYYRLSTVEWPSSTKGEKGRYSFTFRKFCI